MYRYGPNPAGLHHPALAWLVVAFGLALLAALVVVGIVLVVRLTRTAAGPARSPGPTPVRPADPAFTELRLRYARGEIGWDDYVQRAAALGYPQTPPGPGPTGPPTTPVPPG